LLWDLTPKQTCKCFKGLCILETVHLKSQRFWNHRFKILMPQTSCSSFDPFEFLSTHPIHIFVISSIFSVPKKISELCI
jgi:hypothetical protein